MDFGFGDELIPDKTISDQGYVVVTQKEESDGITLTEDEIKEVLEKMAEESRETTWEEVVEEGHSGGEG